MKVIGDTNNAIAWSEWNFEHQKLIIWWRKQKFKTRRHYSTLLAMETYRWKLHLYITSAILLIEVENPPRWRGGSEVRWLSVGEYFAIHNNL